MHIAIYLLVDQDGTPRYVGKSGVLDRRIYTHRYDHEWFGGYFVLEWTTPATWREREGFWIAYFRRLGFPLENKNNGGSGELPGAKRPPEVCANVSKALTGRKLSASHRASISRGQLGRVLPFEHRKALSVALTGKKKSPEHVKKYADAQRGRSLAPGHLRALTAACRTPEARERCRQIAIRTNEKKARKRAA